VNAPLELQALVPARAAPQANAEPDILDVDEASDEDGDSDVNALANVSCLLICRADSVAVARGADQRPASEQAKC
jgi:hypothetical protein